MFSSKVRFFLLPCAALIAPAAAISLLAPPPQNNPGGRVFQYAVKFACVTEVGPASTTADSPFIGAAYRTVVNVHNPEAAAAFTKRAVVARSQRSPRGVSGSAESETLQRGQALAIDCIDIANLLGGAQPIGDGFLIIESPSELDVAAVYTAATPNARTIDVEIDVEYIQPKVLTGRR